MLSVLFMLRTEPSLFVLLRARKVSRSVDVQISLLHFQKASRLLLLTEAARDLVSRRDGGRRKSGLLYAGKHHH